jgi:rhamnosyltransferase
MTPPLISIVMRSYNEAWALKETLPALAAQDYPSMELIVIDSGSTDGSQELIRAANPAHFIQITPQEYNPSRVMNHGMRLAKVGPRALPQRRRHAARLELAPPARRRPAR